ncbi:MAG: hypothetical protein K0R09_3938, partial [Clostridiales bacterium]|nr:hypothetical protein [Clostridiales bacterium]
YPYPHFWIQVDNGALVESAAEPYIRIKTNGGSDCMHSLKVIFKSATEKHHRWYEPLVSKVCFKGVEVEQAGKLEKDARKIIEFVGDSITEGVLIDEKCKYFSDDEALNRVYQDDVCATYAWLTAEKLNLRPRIMGYGAVGVTKSGAGGVPKATVAYPYVYNGCMLTETSADYIVINHGANDRSASKQEFMSEYSELIKLIRKMNPNSKIICLSAFIGVHTEELKEMVQELNRKYNDDILYIDSRGWIPPEPLHPLRDGHIKIAEKLVEALDALI